MNEDHPLHPDDEDPAYQQLLDDALSTGYGSPDDEPAASSSVLDQLMRDLGDAGGVRLREPEAAHGPAGEAGDAGLRGHDPRYEVKGEIGMGGVGRVYRARDSQLGREVAIKVLNREHGNRPDVVSRFVEEAQIGGQLNHPSILPVHELGLWGSRTPFFAMKLVTGDNLARLLDARATLDEERSRFLSVFAQVCQAVAYAHSRGVIHRDLKPANVMVGEFGEVQVMDWGMAKVLDRTDPERPNPERPEDAAPMETIRSQGDGEKSVAGAVMGTPAYLAPEQAQGKVDAVDERTDVFGLGGVLCKILTGRGPHVGQDDAALREAAREADLSGAMRRLEECGAECGVDDELIDLARRCLQPEPGSRPRDAGVVAGEVEAYLAGVQERAHEAHVASVLAGEKAAGARRSQRFTMAIAVALLLALVSGIGFVWVRGKQEQRRADITAQIGDLLDESRRLHGAATAAAEDATGSWEAALASLDPVRALMQNEDVSEDLRVGVADLEAKLQSGRMLASNAARDRAKEQSMRSRLEEIGLQIEDAEGSFLRDDLAVSRRSGYTKAFAEFGLAVDGGTVDDVAKEIRGTRIAERLAVALDDWAASERLLRSDKESAARAQRLQRIALLADPDDWRRELRLILIGEDTGGKIDRKALHARAVAAKPAELPELSIVMLARELWGSRRESMLVAVRFLTRAHLTREHRGSYVIAVELGLAHTYAPKPDWQAARLALRTALGLRPKSVAVLVSYARTLKELGDLDKSAAILRDALELDEECAYGWCELGDVQRLKRDFDRAIETYRRAIALGNAQKLHPWRRSMALRDLSLVYNDRRDRTEAIAVLEEARKVDPRNQVVLNSLGDHLRQNRDYDEAIAALEQAVKLQKGWSDPVYNLGMVYRDQKRHKEAVRYFKSALALQKSADTHNELGAALRNNGEVDAAIAQFEAAIKMRPEWWFPRQNLGLAYQATSRVDRAIVTYTEAIDHIADPSHAHMALGGAYYGTGEYDRSIASLKKAVELRPDRAPWRSNLGWVLQTTGDLDGAIEQYEAAIEANDSFYMAHNNLGRLLIRVGRYEEAHKRLQKGYELEGVEDPSLPLRVVQSFAARGDRLHAIFEGKAKTEDIAELLLAARLADHRHRNRAFVRVWRRVFELEPSYAENLKERYRYKASRRALLAAAGKGDGAADLSTSERAALRTQAVKWLKVDLAAWRQTAQTGKAKRPKAIEQLRRALVHDHAMSSIRDPASIKKLPAAEAATCTALWEDYRRLLAQFEKVR